MLRTRVQLVIAGATAVVTAVALNLVGPAAATAAAAIAARAAAVLACPANPTGTYGVDPNALANDGGGNQLITEVAAGYSSKSATFTAWNKGADGCWTPAVVSGQPAMPYVSEIGYNGLTDHRHESDGTTPTGMYDFQSTFYGISDVDPNPAYTYHHLVCGDWWDEASSDAQYNQFVHVPCGTTPSFASQSEALWTTTTAYQHFAVLNFNPPPTNNPIGSGIFMHDDTDSGVTAGCIALPNSQLDAVLGWMTPSANPHILIATQAEISQLSTRPLPTVGLGAGQTETLHVAGAGVSTVFGTLTVTNPTGSGWVTAYPCALGRPVASNINYAAGQTIADSVALQPDVSGNACFYTSAAADILWDQVAETALPSHNAVRLLDTRTSGTRVGAGQAAPLHVADAGITTVFGTLTVTDPTGGGWVTAYPCAQGRPLASNINFATGQTIADLVALEPDVSGNVCFYTSAAAHILWDQVAETAVPSHNAVRRLDTRTSGSAVGAGQTKLLQVADGGVATVFGTLTVTDPVGPGWVTAYPCAQGRPLASNINFAAGQT